MHSCLMFGALQRALLGSQTACETPVVVVITVTAVPVQIRDPQNIHVINMDVCLIADLQICFKRMAAPQCRRVLVLQVPNAAHVQPNRLAQKERKIQTRLHARSTSLKPQFEILA